MKYNKKTADEKIMNNLKQFDEKEWNEIQVKDSKTIGNYEYDKDGLPSEDYVSIADFKKMTNVSITEKHEKKMDGMLSLNTSCMFNRFCRERVKNKEMICSECFSIDVQNIRKNMIPCYHKNGMTLKNKVIPFEMLPNLNCKYFRFESFGDLEDEIQLFNYFRICIKNPEVRFALWTKNPWIVDSVIKQGYEKPSNLNIILSSPYMNEEASFEKYTWADGTFTVYTKEYCEENDIKINCGAKNCFTCGKCYKKSETFMKIKELLKSDQKTKGNYKETKMMSIEEVK